MAFDAAIIDRASDWHLRQAELTDAQWEDFVLWLEAHPDHAAAYDRIAICDRLVAEVRLPAAAPMAAPLAANDDAPARRRWLWSVGGGAIAAGIVAMLVPTMLPKASDRYLLKTEPGQRREIALADGTRIEMNGGTQLWLDRTDARVASLDAGEAVFHVHHDAGAPFTLRSGALTVQDVGTVFNVVRTGQQLDVAVAEGAVMFQPGRDGIQLEAGNAISVREDLHSLRRLTVQPATVGGWRGGQLSFEGQTLEVVAEAIRRRYGTKLRLQADLSRRPFTGMIEMTGEEERDIPHLAALIGAGWRRDGESWVLAPISAGAL